MSPTSYQLLHPAMFILINMAEEEGFEPPRRSHALSVFKTDPFSRTWVFLHILIGSGGGTRTPNLTGMNRTL